VNGERITVALPLPSMPKSDAAEPMTLASSSSPPVTLITVSARITVIVLCSGRYPSSTWSGGHGVSSSRSARQRL